MMAITRVTNELLEKYSLVKSVGTDLSIVDVKSMLDAERMVESDRILVMLCESGTASLILNGRKRSMRMGDIAICPPGVTLGEYKGSADSEMKMLGMSYAKLRRSFYSGRNFWSVIMCAKNNPVFHLSESDTRLTLAYYNVIKLKIDTERGFYYNEIIHTLLECAVLEISVIVNRGITPDNSDGKTNRHDHIFKHFMELLVSGNNYERAVSYYAEKLCISPKYLSAVCVSMAGKPALALILENVASAIEHKLVYTDLSIKEIAMEMNFPDVSSFGKFVRSRFGMSPREFRRKRAKE